MSRYCPGIKSGYAIDSQGNEQTDANQKAQWSCQKPKQSAAYATIFSLHHHQFCMCHGIFSDL
jgi:hypothetical protein